MTPDPSTGPLDGFAAALTADEREQLTREGRRRRFARGATLFNEGESSDRVIILLSGRVKICYFTEDGREVVLALRSAGDILGELSALDGEPRSASAIALEPVEALLLGAGEFRDFLSSKPRVALLLLEMLARRLRDADRKRVEFGAYDTVGRVARRLVELADRFGEPDGNTVRIDLPLSQDELAGWIGASRKAVGNALAWLRERNLIETRRRGVTITDLDALRRRAT